MEGTGTEADSVEVKVMKIYAKQRSGRKTTIRLDSEQLAVLQDTARRMAAELRADVHLYHVVQGAVAVATGAAPKDETSRAVAAKLRGHR
jgi:hypothetical protein